MKKKGDVGPYILSSSVASFHLRFLVVYFLLDERTISGMDLIEMTLKGGMVASVVHTTVIFGLLMDLEHRMVGA